MKVITPGHRPGCGLFSAAEGKDGLYTRPYFSYFDSEGHAHKPFVMPQEEPGFYFEFMKSFNIPELVTDRIDTDPRKLSDIVKSSPREVEAEF